MSGRGITWTFAGAMTCLSFCAEGCKPDQPAQAVPVGSYIQPDAPPTYVSPRGESKHGLSFTDITEQAGIDFQHVTGAFGEKWMPETMGGGAAFLDYDGDEHPDILFVNSSYWPEHEPDGKKPTGRLYRSRGDGTFDDVSESTGISGISCYGMGPAIADFDGDGDPDVYITAVGRNTLLRNDAGVFVDVTDQAGVGFGIGDGQASDWEWSTGAAWVDHDRDGDLDLFVANYVQWTPQTDIWTTLDGKSKSYATPQRYEGASCLLFRNNGDGAFTDVTKQAGVHNSQGKSLGVVTDDFNDDGWPDIVVTNDTQPNFLYVSNQDGTFTDQALSLGVAYDENGLARAGMGVTVADVAGDGRRAIAIGNFSGEPVSLYTQTPAKLFVDRAGPARLTKPTDNVLTFGLLFADMNLDGYDDLLAANGHIEPEIEHVKKEWTFAQPPQLFLNNRAAQFVDIGAEIGEAFPRPMVARALATADIDGDGDLDVLFSANGGKPRLLRNDLSEKANVVRVRLIGRGKNRDAVGARLRAVIGDHTVSRYVTTGGSYLSQSELTATMGLGAAEKIDRLDIRWPDGAEQSFSDVAANREYLVEQGQGVAASKPLSRSVP